MEDQKQSQQQAENVNVGAETDKETTGGKGTEEEESKEA